MNPITPLAAQPADATPDVGPCHRGGPFALFAAAFCAFSAAGGALLLWREGQRAGAIAVATLLGAAALWACWCLIERWRSRDTLPRSHSILGSALAFELRCTCRDVAATMFFDPDQLAPGSSTQLLCFVENYASRRRVAQLRIGPHAGLGLPNVFTVALSLAAGQAAVYALPLSAAPTLTPGQHDLPITLTVDKPAGTGARLPGAPHHLYDLWKMHVAAPFTVVTDAAAPHASVPRPPRFVALASVSEKEPRLAALTAVVAPIAAPDA